MAIDFQGLLEVMKAGEQNPHLKMNSWQCGTAACLIGSFCIQHPEDRLRIHKGGLRLHPPQPEDASLSSRQFISQRFGITRYEADWLFMANPLLRLRGSCDRTGFQPDAMRLSGEEALTRLRKFIYYKLHRQEMEHETARRVSGNKAAALAAEVVC